jgi:acyl-homoserine lactone acylase PvdQ
VLLAVLAFAATAQAGGPPAEPYGAHDAGGFLNVLPPGENGLDNAVQLAQFELTGQTPPHWDDQQPLYENLLYGSPGLTDSKVGDYFKDATFGVKQGDAEFTTSPEPGLTIVRDAGYGVPHIYGQTRGDVEFGTGYAAAQDRLFLMDVLRHAARAQLSSFAGGDPSNREMDREVWENLPYTEADLRGQIRNGVELYGGKAKGVIRDARQYVAGVNAYIDEALSDPSKLPAEYAAIGKTPQPWKLTDSIALAGLIGLEQGQAGGNELGQADMLRALVDRFGRAAGRRAWRDFREQNDPETPVTVHRRFPYESANPFSKRGLAMPDPGSVHTTPAGPPLAKSAGSGIGAALQQGLRADAPDSNVLLARPSESSTSHAIAVMGPQVDYYVPEILMEEDLHGPGIEARGASFPGVNQYVQLGHGRDFSWSATSAETDNVDTFAEVLCHDAYHYRYHGRCRPMQKLERTNSWTPNGADQTPPGSETLTVYRTAHGIVYARGKVDGRPVAFSHARTTYLHEADSALGFRELNDPGYLTGPRRFRTAVDRINFLFNWFYVDPRHIAYQQSGWYPRRAPGTSPDFPILGTGRFDWQGFHPSKHTTTLLGVNAHPHAVDPRFLVSWNNKPAPGWSAPEDSLAWGPVFRSQLLSDKVAAGIRGARRISPASLVSAMEESASQDLRAHELLPILLRAIGRPGNPRLLEAVLRLRAWERAGAHRRDLDQDGHDEYNAAIQTWDAWYPRLVQAEFKPTLGHRAYGRIKDMSEIGTHVGGDSFFGGWWGFVSKDLRDLYGPQPRGAFGRVYCGGGGGSKHRCRAALRSSLADALDVTPAELYGHGDCQGDPEPACSDRNTWNGVAGVDMPSFPFQNRPTFQQVATPGHPLP